MRFRLRESFAKFGNGVFGTGKRQLDFPVDEKLKMVSSKKLLPTVGERLRHGIAYD